MNIEQKREVIIAAQRSARDLGLLQKARQILGTIPCTGPGPISTQFRGITIRRVDGGMTTPYEIRLNDQEHDNVLVFSGHYDCAAQVTVTCFRDGPWLKTFLDHSAAVAVTKTNKIVEDQYPYFKPLKE